MYVETSLHRVVKIERISKLRDDYCVDYIVITDEAGNTLTVKAFSDNGDVEFTHTVVEMRNEFSE